MKRILVPTAGAHSALECAEYVMTLAQAIDADVHVLHVISENSESDFEDAYDATKVFELASEEPGVHVTGVVRYGDVAKETIEYASQNEIDLIVMGASRGEVVEQWLSSEVLGHSAIPVLVIPMQIFENTST